MTPWHTRPPYTIIAKPGESGMGQVFRARDTKLNRDVAPKVLPDPCARGAIPLDEALTCLRTDAS